MLGDRGVCGLECCLEPNLQRMTSQCNGIGLMSCQTYLSVRYRVDVCADLTEVSGTGIDVVPIPVPAPVLSCIPVPTAQVLMSYRTYSSIRCRY